MFGRWFAAESFCFLLFNERCLDVRRIKKIQTHVVDSVPARFLPMAVENKSQNNQSGFTKSREREREREREE